MTTPPVGRIEFEGSDPFYRPAGAPIKPTTGKQTAATTTVTVAGLPTALALQVTTLSQGRRGEFIDRLKAMMCLNCCRVYNDGNPMPPRCQCWNDE